MKGSQDMDIDKVVEEYNKDAENKIDIYSYHGYRSSNGWDDWLNKETLLEFVQYIEQTLKSEIHKSFARYGKEGTQLHKDIRRLLE